MWINRATGKPSPFSPVNLYSFGIPETCFKPLCSEKENVPTFCMYSFRSCFALNGMCLGVIAFWNILCNIIILFFLLAGLPFAILTARHSPFKRGLFCNDESIQYPYKVDTISYELLAGIIVPFDVIVVSFAPHFPTLHCILEVVVSCLLSVNMSKGEGEHSC